MDSTDSLGTAEPNLIELLNNVDNDRYIDNPLKINNIENKYYDTDIMSGESNELNNCKLKIIHLNIHSLPDKLDQLKLLLINSNLNPDIILLCETFLNVKNEKLYQLPNYQFVSKCRQNKTCGGVGIYIKNELSYKIKDELATHDEGKFESIFIEIVNNDTKYIVGEIYRAPNTNEQSSIDNYESTLMKLNNTKVDCIIGTDQNFDYLKLDKHKKKQDLLNNFFNHGYIPTIIKPTRITHNTATLIDNIYIKTSKNTKLKSGIIITDISDHLPVFLCIGSTNIKQIRANIHIKQEH